MNKSKTYLLLGVIVAVLVLGIAYATIGDITLNVNGTATASAAEGSFDVQFTGTSSSGIGTVKELEVVETSKGLIASFDVEGLTKVGDEFVAEFTIENKSTDLLANLLLTQPLSNSNTDYFKVTGELNKTNLTQKDTAGNTATLTVKVELLKLPIDTDTVSTTVAAIVTASPENPSI